MEKYEKIAAAFDAQMLSKGPIPRLVMEVREQIQEDLRCYFDAWGMPDHTITLLCDIVVENFKKLLPTKEEK